MRVTVTGGAGFVGANLCVRLAELHPDWEITAFDNLFRRGSELNLARMREAGIHFVHGDVREEDDLSTSGPCDAIVECSAEPSVLASSAATQYSVKTNLFGAFNCLEHAKRHEAQLIFLSTSRVYPVAPLSDLKLRETETRFEIAEEQEVGGAGPEGISEEFPLEGPRTLYGATKLAAELLIAEYEEAFDLVAVINRCGVIAGPWQMGKIDQGVFSWWLLAHLFGRDLRYIGFGGSGKQVRDLLHVFDLVDLIDEQLAEPDRWSGHALNVGGGRDFSLSLHETTGVCRELTGNEVSVTGQANGRPGDVPVYLSDCSRLFSMTSWRPRCDPATTLKDLFGWATEHRDLLSRTLMN